LLREARVEFFGLIIYSYTFVFVAVVTRLHERWTLVRVEY